MRLWSEHKGKILAAMSALTLGLLVLIASVYSWVTSPEFEQLLARNITRLIEERTGLRAELSNLDIDFSSQRVVMSGLVLRGEEDAADPPLASLGTVRMVFNWRALISRRLVLSSLEVLEPRFRLEIGENGTTNMPVPPAAPEPDRPPPFEFEIGDFSIAEGELSFSEERVEMNFRLADFGGAFDYIEATRTLAGQIGYSGAIERGADPAIPYALRADFAYADDTAVVESMEIETGGTLVQLNGRIEEVLGARSGEFDYQGTVSLPFMNYFFPDRQFAGDAQVTGNLAFTTTDFRSEGTFAAESVTFEGWNATAVSSAFTYAYPERLLEATGFEANLFGGQTGGDLRLDHDRDPVRTEVQLDFTAVDAERLRPVYPWGTLHAIRSRTRGTMSGWFDGALRDFDLSGTATFSALDVGSPETPGELSETIDLPISGTSTYRIRPRNADLGQFSVALGSTRAAGTAAFTADSLDVTLSASSDDLSDLAWVFPEANGSGDFEGEISGTFAEPSAEGSFEVANVDVRGTRVDLVRGRGRIDSNSATFESVELALGSSRMALAGSWSIPNAVPNLDVTIERLVPDDVRAVVDIPIDGTLSGLVHLDSITPLEGSGEVRIATLAFEGRSLGDAQLEWQYDGIEVRILDARIEADDRSIGVVGTYAPASERLDIELEVQNQQIEEFHWIGIPSDLTGLIESGSFRVEGSTSTPIVSGSASITDFRVREQNLGLANLEVERRDPGIFARVTAGENVSAEFEIDTSTEGFPFTGTAEFTDYDAARLAGLPSETVFASGSVVFDGAISDLDAVNGRGEISALTAYLQNDTLVVDRPFTFVFDRTRIAVASVGVSSELAEILIEGTVLLEEDFPIDLTVEGRLDLSLLEGPNMPFVTRGNLSLNGSVEGTLDTPDLSGVATLVDVSISQPDLFVGLSQLNGDLFFNGNTVNVNDLEGVAGGGRVTLRGNVAVDGFGPGLMDIRVDASDVRVRTPEGVRAVFEGAAALRGTPDAPSLEGNIKVTNLSFAEGFEEFLTLFSARGAPRPPGPLDSLSLALHVEGDENIRVENELVGVDVRLNLDVSGTAGEPNLTGYVESTSGTLDLQGRRYRVTRGNVSFIDPVGIDPIVDLQAETDIRNYRVILTISGRASDPRLDMRSDPPLPQQEIVSLIAGGRTREEFAEESTENTVAPTSEELFQSASATILTDLLAERVGSRFGLLNRVRIDPFLVGAENDPVARITISEQVTSNLEITYSQDLSSNRQQIIQIEYFLDDGTSFVASRDETGAAGLDVQFRKRFR